MQVLVTGGSGLIGRAAVRELLARGHCVTTLHRGPASDPPAGVAHVRADVASAAARQAAADAEGVLHLAGRGDVLESWQAPGAYLQLVVGGTLNLLEGARQGGARLVLASTQRVYRPARRPLRETDRPHPDDPYALAKLAAEGVARLYAQRYGLATRAARLFSVYGPGQVARGNSGVVAIFLGRAAADDDLLLEAGPKRDFVYVDDVALGLCLALEQARPGFRVYNVGSGQGTALGDLAETVVRATGSRSRIVPDSRPWTAGDLVPDLTRTKRELGYRPRVSLEEGLRRTWTEPPGP